MWTSVEVTALHKHLDAFRGKLLLMSHSLLVSFSIHASSLEPGHLLVFPTSLSLFFCPVLLWCSETGTYSFASLGLTLSTWSTDPLCSRDFFWQGYHWTKVSLSLLLPSMPSHLSYSPHHAEQPFSSVCLFRFQVYTACHLSRWLPWRIWCSLCCTNLVLFLCVYRADK